MGGGAMSGVPSILPRTPQQPVGQRIKSIYTDRLRQFTQKGQYEGQNLVSYVCSLPVYWLSGRS